MAKIKLLLKQMAQEAYRFFMTMIALTLFLVMSYYVSKNGLQDDVNYLSICGMSLLCVFYAIMHPLIVNAYLYRTTDANHMYSIPMTRFEIFFSQYLLGLFVGLGMILSYTCLTTLVSQGQAVWLTDCSFLIVIFLFYYHLSLFCYWISGNRLFYLITLLVFIFGPLMIYLIGVGIMEEYVIGFVSINHEEICFLLLPIFKMVEFSVEGGVNESYYPLYLCLSVFMLVMNLVAVRYRPIEKTGEAIIFKPLSYFMRMICCILASGVFLAISISVNGYQLKREIFFSDLIISLVCVYCVEMLFAKKVKVFYSLKYAIPLLMTSMIFLYGGQRLLTNYIPMDYDGVQIAGDYHFSWVSFNYTDENAIDSSPEMLRLAKDIHQDILADTSLYASRRYPHDYSIRITYYDDTKEKMEREYSCSEKTVCDLFEPYLANRELYDRLTFFENHLIEVMIKKEEPLKIERDSEEWLIDTPELRYRFSHYLAQILDEEFTYIQETHDLSHLFSDDDVMHLYFVEENKGDLYGLNNRDFIYRALQKALS